MNKFESLWRISLSSQNLVWTVYEKKPGFQGIITSFTMMLNKFERTLDITKQNFNELLYFPVELESYIGAKGEIGILQNHLLASL